MKLTVTFKPNRTRHGKRKLFYIISKFEVKTNSLGFPYYVIHYGKNCVTILQLEDIEKMEFDIEVISY